MMLLLLITVFIDIKMYAVAALFRTNSLIYTPIFSFKNSLLVLHFGLHL